MTAAGILTLVSLFRPFTVYHAIVFQTLSCLLRVQIIARQTESIRGMCQPPGPRQCAWGAQPAHTERGPPGRHPREPLR